MQFRKKPVAIEAFQWFGDERQTEDPVWIVEAIRNGTAYYDQESGTFKIKTLEGEMSAQQGDWIIQGVHGEIYPCKPDIFEKTYEPVGPAS